MKEMKKFDVLEMKMVIDNKEKTISLSQHFFLMNLGVIYPS